MSVKLSSQTPNYAKNRDRRVRLVPQSLAYLTDTTDMCSMSRGDKLAATDSANQL